MHLAVSGHRLLTETPERGFDVTSSAAYRPIVMLREKYSPCRAHPVATTPDLKL